MRDTYMLMYSTFKYVHYICTITDTYTLESDTVMDFVPFTAPLPSVSYRSRDIIPVTVSVALLPLPLPYFYYHSRSRFHVQFDESNIC